MKHLRLKGVGLDQCPEGIGRLNKLETLDLSDNRIDVLEQSTASLFKLTMLDLSANGIPVWDTPLLVCAFMFPTAIRITSGLYKAHGVEYELHSTSRRAHSSRSTPRV